MSLTRYKSLRDFTKTPEPTPAKGKEKSASLEFVVHKHHASHLHYDFRLEMGGVLKSWAVPKGPSLNPSDKRLAMMVEDHPYDYRKFEGVIPKKSYGAGNVIIWDRGTYEPRQKTDSKEEYLLKQLKRGRLTIVLRGQKLNGEFGLIKSPSMGDNAWLLVKKKDRYAGDIDVTGQDQSVVSGRRVEELSQDKIDLSSAPKAGMPKNVRPQLATLTDEPFDDVGWLFEIKWDGYRALGQWDGRSARLYSRQGNGFSHYKPILESLRRLEHKVVLDGEVVAVDAQGKANFGWLQDYGRAPKGQLVYYVFDILWCDGHDLTGLPLSRRKEILAQLGNVGLIHYSDHIDGAGNDFYSLAKSQNLEGIIAKKADSKYHCGRRSKQWLKIKTELRQEAVIGGFTEPSGSRKHIGALILGVYGSDGRLHYIGHTGGGIPSSQLRLLRQSLEKLEVSKSPFSESFKPNAPAHWLKPSMVCEVSFSEWTSTGHMRQPIFKGLRDDKKPKQVVREMPLKTKAVASKPAKKNPASRVDFSHLDKIFFPSAGTTKGDLVNYYQDVGEYILPYIKDRPHSLLRQPNGIDGDSFFQKDVNYSPPDWVKTKAIYSESNKKDINYLVADSMDSLLYMVQLGCIEINPWNSKIEHLDNPDWCVIDLDPERISFSEVIQAAKAVNQVCKELNIVNLAKTSGKTGIHIYIPLAAKYNYEQTKQFAQLLANLVHQRLPKTTSLERSPKKRQGKVYLDYLQNRKGQTLAAPYCVRPTPSASVSAPIDWKEVNSRLNPAEFNIKNMGRRLKDIGDIWQPVIGKGIDIEKVLAHLD
ncbi:MAG TPA: DNA ligase D [Candidatus Saccharimonadales bacterium]|nr:DNA ligase D [Candidatus Saccharimonadales bacterium]